MKRIILLAAIALMMAACATAPESVGRYSVDEIVAAIHNPNTKTVLVASHRGDWRNYPENSLDAIESVIRMGVDIVEIDLKMTVDSVLILMHDHKIDRTTSGKGYVKDLTIDSIRHCTLRAGQGVVTDCKIPTLEEALQVCKGRIVINVDQGYEYYDLVHAMLEKYDMMSQVLIKGNKSPVDVAEKMSHYQDNMMYMPIINYRQPSGSQLFAEYGQTDAPLAYEVVWTQMTPEVEQCMKQVIASGSKLWTNSLWASLCGGLEDDKAINDPEAIYGKHLAMGSTMIQTDRPELLLNYLRSKKLHK